MKVCFINGWAGGSTGTIIKNISQRLEKLGECSACFIYREKSNNIGMNVLQLRSDFFSYELERLHTFLFGNDGFCNNYGTKRACKFLSKMKPDIIHLHNIHSSFINVEKILKYAKQNNIKVVWTLHDAWLVTGRCCYFFSCNGWRYGCKKCSHKNYYPTSIKSNFYKIFIKKEKLISDYQNIVTFVSPSNWLKKLVETRYPFVNCLVIRNGIDKNVFNYLPSIRKIDFGENTTGKFKIGIAAYLLNKAKGLDFIKKLASKIDGKRFVIIGCGAKQKEIKKNKNPNLILLPRINSRDEMKKFYHSIDVMLNPTQQDNFPTTNLECISCGTPVICFKTGGATEAIVEGVNGCSVEQNNLDQTIDAINAIYDKRINPSDIVKTSEEFSIDIFANKYLQLYKDILGYKSK